MFRRRRRSTVRVAGRGYGRSRRGGPRGALILAGAAAIVLFGGVLYLANVADGLERPRETIRIELPNVLDQ